MLDAYFPAITTTMIILTTITLADRCESYWCSILPWCQQQVPVMGGRGTYTWMHALIHVFIPHQGLADIATEDSILAQVFLASQSSTHHTVGMLALTTIIIIKHRISPLWMRRISAKKQLNWLPRAMCHVLMLCSHKLAWFVDSYNNTNDVSIICTWCNSTNRAQWVNFGLSFWQQPTMVYDMLLPRHSTAPNSRMIWYGMVWYCI